MDVGQGTTYRYRPITFALYLQPGCPTIFIIFEPWEPWVQPWQLQSQPWFRLQF
jgi:hypothetical protein